MTLQTEISNELGPEFRQALTDNFKELDRCRTDINGHTYPTENERLNVIEDTIDHNNVNINSYVFDNLNERLNYIEGVLKSLGLPIDPKEAARMNGEEEK